MPATGDGGGGAAPAQQAAQRAAALRSAEAALRERSEEVGFLQHELRELHELQRDDGSFTGGAYATGMSLLGLALNYRFLPIYER